MTLVILKPGLLTTVQDLGRWGHQAEGVPVGGPMDPYAHRLANHLVGNADTAATLELTLIGPEILFERDHVMAITGADLSPAIDDRPLPMRTVSAVGKGQRLRFGGRREGTRAYLALAGGIETIPVFGSRATQLVSGMGGVEGRALRAGDRLPVGVPSEPPIPGRTLPPVVPLPAGGADLRIIPGPEAETCAEMLQSIASHTFTISSTSDRMAYRLETCRPESDVRRPRPTSLSEVRGPESEVRGQVSVEIISDATPLGTVQLPPSGQPMILMADRQTCGGYPRIATVIAADLARAGQLAPGDWVRFHRCTLAEAMAALIEQERVFVR